MAYLYTKEECQKQAEDITDIAQKELFVYEMRNNFVCSNDECKEIRKLSKAEVVTLSLKAKQKQGKKAFTDFKDDLIANIRRG